MDEGGNGISHQLPLLLARTHRFMCPGLSHARVFVVHASLHGASFDQQKKAKIPY
jgi:hypothetical protein